MSEQEPNQLDASKGPEGRYTRESAVERLKNLNGEEKEFFEWELSLIGYTLDQVCAWFLENDLLEEKNVEGFVRNLALLVGDLRFEQNTQTGKKAAAKKLATFIANTFE